MMRVLLLSVLVLFSCNSTKDKTQQNKPFEILLQSATGGKTTQDFVVVTDAEALNTLYASINQYEEKNYQIPKIDFDSSMIIALFMGEKSSGGYEIIVDSIIETQDKVVVNYKITEPEATEGVIMAITQPYCIIETSKSSKEIEFVRIDH